MSIKTTRTAMHDMTCDGCGEPSLSVGEYESQPTVPDGWMTFGIARWALRLDLCQDYQAAPPLAEWLARNGVLSNTSHTSPI